jgi:class I fructose-bisphosphate aldolase
MGHVSDFDIRIFQGAAMSAAVGKAIRLSRILTPESGRGIVVAMDHGMFIGAGGRLLDMEDAVRLVADAGPQALQIHHGMASRFHAVFHGRRSPSLVLRVDTCNQWRKRPTPREGYRVLVSSIREAAVIGADAVCCFLFTGYPNDTMEGDNMETVAGLAQESRTWGIPLVVEPLAMEAGKDAVRDPELVKLLVRMAAELGADLIKADYTDKRTFRDVVRVSPVPILIRGGPKTETAREALEMVKDGMEAGAKGLVFGRNVWDLPDPAKMMRALSAIVHENASVDKALKLLK